MDPLLNRIDRERSCGKAIGFAAATLMNAVGSVFAFCAAYLLIRNAELSVKMSGVVALTLLVAFGGSVLSVKLFSLLRSELRSIRTLKPKALSKIHPP